MHESHDIPSHMHESHDVLSHMHQQPWAQLVAKFNKSQTGARRPSQPGSFFTEDEFNKYSLQPSWKQLVTLKEQELCVTSQNAPSTVPPAGSSQVTPPTAPQAVETQAQGKLQSRKEKSCSGQQVAPPIATGRPNQGKAKGRLPYPRPSWLTKAEQKLYLELYDKYMSYVPTKASAVEVKEINQLKELQLRVAAEQNEYMSFLETSARTFPEDYAYIHTEANTYVEKHLSWKRSRVTAYPRYYTILDSVSLAPPRSIAEQVSFVHVQTLLRVGTAPKVILPKVRTDMRPHVPMNYAKVNSNFPAASTDNTRKKVCSVDATAERLAKKYKVDVVISASGLKCLLDNSAPVYPQSWELPVTVREYIGEGDTTYRVVYVDQPLVPKVMSMREKNTCYFKAALKTLLQHPRHGNPSESRTNYAAGSSLANGSDDTNNRELFGSVATSLDDLETFGTGVRAAKLRQGQRNCMPSEAKVKPETIDSQSGVNLKVDASEGVNVSDRETSGRTNESGSLHQTEASQIDTTETGSMEVDSQVDDCTVMAPKIDTVASASSTDNAKGFSVVTQKRCVNAECSADVNSSDSDSDNGLVIDISANLDSQDGDSAEVNPLPCDETAGVRGQTHARSEVVPREVATDLLQDVCGTDGNNESVVTDVKREINGDVSSPVDIEMKAEINESESDGEKDVVKEEVTMEKVTDRDIQPQTLCVGVVTRLGHDDTVIDTASDMSSPRRRSQRCRTKATNDASFVSDTTLTAESPRRRSLRTLVTRSVTEGGGAGAGAGAGAGVGAGGGKTSPGDRRRTRSVAKKTSEDGQNAGQRGVTRHCVGDTQTDADDTTTKRRRSSRLTTKAQGEVTTEVASDVGVTTRSKRQRSMTPGNGVRTTRRTGEDTREEVQGDTQESDVMTQDDDTRTTPDVASGDNHSCVSVSVNVTGEPADVSSNKSLPETATAPDSVIGCHDNQCTDVANSINPTAKVVSISKNVTSSVRDTNPKTNDMSDATTTGIASDVQISTRTDSAADTNTDDACRDHTGGHKERESQAEVSGEVGKDTRAVEGEDSVCASRRDTRTHGRKRPAVGDNATSSQRQQKAPCPATVHTPLDTILLAQQKLLQPTYPSRQQCSVLPPSGSALPPGDEMVASAPQCTVPSGEWETSEDPASYPTEPPPRSDLSYDLWTLGNVRLLVRSRCHGKITPYRKPVYHVELSPKLEYQSTYGLELVTPSEASRNWTSLCIHNNCRLVRARINCFTSEVMVLEEVDMSRVVPPRCAFQPASAVSVLHRVLTKLHSLSSGQYLLSHTPNSGHANLKKSTNNDIGAYDLHRAHSGSPSADVSGNHPVPWIPIDTSLLLPHHKKYNRIPATFEPKDAAGQPKAQQNQKKNKKKKKKKKGQGQGQATAKTGTQN